MKKPLYGVIDIGTTKIKSSIISVNPDGTLNKIFSSNTLTCLGVGIQENNYRPRPEYLNQTVDELRNLRKIFDEKGVNNTRVVSTHVMRKLKNTHEIKNIINEETGFTVETISDHEEAEHFFNAVIQSFTDNAQQYVLIDVGGGSVQIITGTKNGIENIYSIPTGTLSLQERFVPDLNNWDDYKTSEEDIENSKKHIQKYLRGLKLPKDAPLIYGSSMIIDVVEIIKLPTKLHKDSKAHPYIIDSEDLKKMIDHIGQFTFIQRDGVFTELPNRFTWGMDVGFLNAVTIAEHIEAPYIIPSNANIAEGLILSMISD